MMNVRLIWLVALSSMCTFLIGCVVSTPPQQDRLSGLIQPEQLKTGSLQLTNTTSKKLAIVYSINVPKSLDSNTQLMSRFTGILGKMITLTDNSTDASIVLSSDKLLEGVISPLRSRFQSVVVAKDLREAFSQGADLVAVLDIRLAYTFDDRDSRSTMRFTHTADASYLFINRRLESGPELLAQVTHEQVTPAAGSDANNRDFLVHARIARVKMLETLRNQATTKLLP